ncbi:MAG: hypothetical protein ACI4QE_01760 [Acutalibacteraceae bacterium]
MMTEIIVALIGLGGSAIGSIIGILTSSKLTAYRLEQLEQKVNKHNNLIERMYKAEENINILGEKVKEANHRLCDIEEREDMK